MKRAIKLILPTTVLVATMIISFASTPIGQMVVKATEGIKFLCWFGCGDIEIPQSIKTDRRKRMGLDERV